MGLFSRDPIEKEARRLEREAEDVRINLLFDCKEKGYKAGGPEWKAAEQRGKELRQQARDLRKGR